jgi:hypothetical protein
MLWVRDARVPCPKILWTLQCVTEKLAATRAHVRKDSAWQLDRLRLDILESIKTLNHISALQETNRAYTHLQVHYPMPSTRLREARVLIEDELSGMADPEQTVKIVEPDDNGQCPEGTMWNARVGGCMDIEDWNAQTGFDTTKGGNAAASDLRKARALTGRKQFLPEGTDARLDQGGSNRLHLDNYGTPNRAMGDAGAIEVSDRNIDTEQMPGGNRLNDATKQTRSARYG